MNTYTAFIFCLGGKVVIVSLTSQVESCVDDGWIPLIVVDRGSDDAFMRHALQVPRPRILFPGLKNVVCRFDDDLEMLARPLRSGVEFYLRCGLIIANIKLGPLLHLLPQPFRFGSSARRFFIFFFSLLASDNFRILLFDNMLIPLAQPFPPSLFYSTSAPLIFFMHGRQVVCEHSLDGLSSTLWNVWASVFFSRGMAIRKTCSIN
jgi:hypothetical protein